MPLHNQSALNLDEEITLTPFNPQWSKIYRTEASRLHEKLGGKIVTVEHIGSTAIPAIHTKPIIDIMIGIKSLTETKPIIKSLQELGYEYCGEANVPGRLYFRIRNKNGQNFNLAVCQHQSALWTDNLLFRDYLLEHPDIAQRYSLLKKEILAAGANTLLKYSELKHAFVEEIIAKAKKQL